MDNNSIEQKNEKVKQLLWVTIVPFVICGGITVALSSPKVPETIRNINSPLITIPFLMGIFWMVSSYITRNNFMVWLFRILAGGALSLFFSYLLPNWPLWSWFTIAFSIAAIVPLLMKVNPGKNPIKATAHTKTVVTPSGRKEEVAVGIEMKSAQSNQSTFVDAAPAINNLGYQAQANLLAASNQADQITLERLKLTLESLKTIFNNPEVDQKTRERTLRLYHKKVQELVPDEINDSSKSEKPTASSWDMTPYIRGR